MEGADKSTELCVSTFVYRRTFLNVLIGYRGDRRIPESTYLLCKDKWNRTIGQPTIQPARIPVSRPGPN